MNRQLFRPRALERLSSPEQLDHTMHVVSPMYWTSLLGLTVLLATAAVWSWTGSIPSKTLGQGVIIRPGGVFNISSSGAGYVKSFSVKVGDHVKSGQVIAQIDQPETTEQIKALEQRLLELRRDINDSVAVHRDTSAREVSSLETERTNAEREIQEQEGLAKVAADELTLNQQLFAKGLITRQPVVDAQQRLISIQSAIGRLKSETAHVNSQEFQTRMQPDELRRQRQSEIDELEMRLQATRHELGQLSNVVSPISGEVVEAKVEVGTLVPPGASIMDVQPEDDQLLTVIYVSSAQVKDVKEGMIAEISPTTDKREEYGFIRGRVSFVSHYPASGQGMMTLFGNDSLVAGLRGQGVVTEVDIAMERSKDTPSGFKWSSSHGPDAAIAPGTLCTANIVTRSQKPITLIFPFLKKLMGEQ